MGSRYDVQNQLSSAQAITTGSPVSTNSYKLGNATMDPSIGRPMGILVKPTVAAAGSVNATSYEFQAIATTDDALTAGIVVLGSTGPMTAAQMTVDAEILVPIRPGSITHRYIGLRTVVVGGTLPTLTIDAFYVPADEVPSDGKYFPKAVDTLV